MPGLEAPISLPKRVAGFINPTDKSASLASAIMKSVGVYLPYRILANFLSSDFVNFPFDVDDV
jgi:hypothetical protein